MVASAQAAITKACTPVSEALMGTMEKASKFHADQIKDLMTSNTVSGSENQQKLDRIREGKKMRGCAPAGAFLKNKNGIGHTL